MTTHAIGQRLKYWWHAKDRHGVHSPFAYDLNEKVLKTINSSGLATHKWLAPRYGRLLSKLQEHYQYKSTLYLPPPEEIELLKYDVLLLDGKQPGQWISLFNRYRSLLKNSSMVLLADIHKTQRHTAKWQRLQKHPDVRMSIDLYGVGLLFFREEFKEKQHFVLKY